MLPDNLLEMFISCVFVYGAMQTYSLEDIWEKEIYLLIPFYIFTHEANFPKYNEDENLLQGLVDEFKEICVKMEEKVLELIAQIKSE